MGPQSEIDRLHRAGGVWTDRGTAILVSGLPADRAASIRCHLRAIELLEKLPVDSNAEYLADLATAWVNLGCAHLAGDSTESLEQAGSAIDRAIGFLYRLPATPRFRHNLAAAWMNRADASARLGPTGGEGEAIGDFQRAIGIARDLPLDEKPSFRILLGSCWINLGNLRLRLREVPEAVRAYDEALAALGELPAAGHRLACHHAATAWTNRGEALLRSGNLGDASLAVASARRALAWVEGRDLDRPVDAKLSLRALRVLACGLESGLRGRPAGVDRVGELTDVAERGIDLALDNRPSAPEVFDPFVAWFFSFGSRAYGRHQPQFLAEYLRDVLRRAGACAPDPLLAELRSIARGATAETLAELGQGRLLVHGARPTEVFMGAVRGLREASLQYSP